MKLCSRLLMVFGRNPAKNDKFWYLNPTLEKSGVTHDLGWWVAGKSMTNFLFALLNFFRWLLRFQSYEAKCVQLGCFQRGSTSLHSNFTWTGSSPSIILGIRKPDTLGYWMVKTASLCIPSFWHNAGVWRTDGRTDGFAVAYMYSRL